MPQPRGTLRGIGITVGGPRTYAATWRHQRSHLVRSSGPVLGSRASRPYRRQPRHKEDMTEPSQLDPRDLEAISVRTLEHYNQRAEAFLATARGTTTSARTSRRCCAYRGRAALHHPRFRLRAGPRPEGVLRARSRRGRPGRRGAIRGDGARPQRLRGVAAGFPQARRCRTAASMACSPTPRCFTCPSQELPRVLG